MGRKTKPSGGGADASESASAWSGVELEREEPYTEAARAVAASLVAARPSSSRPA